MFSQVRRQSPASEPASVAAGPRSHRRQKPVHRWADHGPSGSWAGWPQPAGHWRRDGGRRPSAAAEAKQGYIVVFKDTVVDPAATAAAHQSTYGVSPSGIYRDAVGGYAATMTASEAQRVQADPGVEFVTVGREFDKPRDPEPPSTQVGPLWRQRIAGPRSDAGNTRVGDSEHPVDVNVAVIDSGIDATHPDLNVRGGIDCTSRLARFRDPH